MIQKIIHYCRMEAVQVAAGILAVISCFFVPPSTAYFGYIDYRVLALLFCLMSVIAGLREIGIFDRLCRALLARVHSARGIVLLLTMLCFVLSMFLTNDVTLVTVVPFTILVFGQRDGRLLMMTLILETVAANLGSMLTPLGNPQNLYLYARYHFRLIEFLGIMLPYTLLSLALILAVSWVVGGRDSLAVSSADKPLPELHRGRCILYFALFLLSIFSVAHLLDYRVLLAVVAVCILFADKRLFLRVDYSLLLTFVFFFIFVGNLAEIPQISELLQAVMSGRELITGILASQVVSNVPAAILLSGFTGQGRALVVGTNLGGLGTLIASMASLITYKFYAAIPLSDRRGYLGWFTAVNVVFLILLYLLTLVIE